VDFLVVFERELLTFRRRFWRYFFAGMVNPLLLLTAFGWGLGRGIQLEGVSYLNYVVPGIIALSTMNASFTSVGVALNISRRYTKTFENYLVAPIEAHSIVLGKVLGGVLRGLLSAAIIVVLARLYGAEVRLSVEAVATILITSFLFASLGMLAGMLIWSHEDMNTFNALFITPMMFLSGTFFSLQAVPYWVAALIKLLPLTHASLCLRAAMLGRDFPVASFAVLLAFALAFFFAGIFAVRRSSQ
jgi:Nod factor-specific ABC transporter NodJ protein